jgi:hypothetical protein
MKKRSIPKAILKKIRLITGKRSRVVVDHILKHSSITTEDLEHYGYKHPPRAIRDVREQGLPLEMFWTKNSSGRKIAGYRLGRPEDIRHDRVGGQKFSRRHSTLKSIKPTAVDAPSAAHLLNRDTSNSITKFLMKSQAILASRRTPMSSCPSAARAIEPSPGHASTV